MFLGWGIVIYAIMFLVWNGFVIYHFTDGILPRLSTLAVLVVLTLLAGRSLKLYSWTDILPYSISWAIMMAALDAMYSVPFTGWHMYQNAGVWVGYALVVLLPLLTPFTRSPREKNTRTYTS